ncbi:hypothetical protein D3C79_989840 [compost metagenome]
MSLALQRSALQGNLLDLAELVRAADHGAVAVGVQGKGLHIARNIGIDGGAAELQRRFVFGVFQRDHVNGRRGVAAV